MANPYDSIQTQQAVTPATQNGAEVDQKRLDIQSRGQTQVHQNLPTLSNFSQYPQQVDVRMKRHPELQPYIPSDRNKFSGTKMNTNTKPVNKARTNMLGVNNTNDAKISAKKPRKYVSMSRLDRLAQPKRVFTRNPTQTKSTGPSPSLTSSNTASTTTNSSLTSTKNHETPKAVPNLESSVADQLSEMSINDQHYQSAASDLLQESENSTDGISFHGNLGSLCQDFDADLIAAGIMKPEMSRTFEVETPQSQIDRDDDDRRRKNEEELEREALRLHKEREQRKSIIEDIMVRVRKDSPRTNNKSAFSS